ncbi:MAG: TlpA family protein disulfide reductase [Thermoleophilia bacterium]|nr:TlpA family protein disulfide reductase [Thermoleophilia bacterium]
MSEAVEPAAPADEPEDGRGWDRRRVLWAAATGVVIAAIAVLLVVGLLNRGVDNSIDEAIARGERAEAPAFTLPVLFTAPGLPAAGRDLQLSALKGKVVVLNIWASWCDPCRDEAPILQSMWNRYRARDVVVLGANVRDLEDEAEEFHDTYGMSFPSVRDGEGDIMGRYGATGVPETFIIDRDGRVAAALRGALVSGGGTANLAAFQNVLDTVIAEKAGTP